MLLSAAHRNVILLTLVFLIGVWVGQSRLIDQQSDGQDNPRGAEIQSELEQRTPFTGGGEVLAKSEDNCMDHFGNKLGNASPTAQKPASGTAVLAPPDECWSKSYSFLEGVALEGLAIEPSPQSMEEDIIRSLEEAGISPEEIPNRVENVMGMILQEDQQTPEAYPSISAP